MSIIVEKVQIVERKTFGVFTLELREDGILHRHISNKDGYTMSSIKELNTVIGEMVNYQPVPIMVTLDDYVSPPSEARSFRAKQNSSPYSKAEAIVAKIPAHQLFTSLYLNADKPERPTRMFENEEEAVQWLKTFL